MAEMESTVKGVEKHVIFHLKNYFDGIYFRRLTRSIFKNNVNTWNAIYRITTEKNLYKKLREWDNVAWWEYASPNWNSKENWETMFSVINKLIKKDEECLKAICYIFVMQNLETRYLSLKRDYRTHQCKSKNTLDYEDLLQLQQFF